ncbi:MAG: DUF3782 domain-containing protein [Candidatus Bathyarchaeia archaeon]
MEISELKAKIFELLRVDLEFRYAIAGLLGLEEILRRLDRHEAELVKLREDFNKLREDFNRKSEEDSKRFTSIETELVKLREDMNKLRGDMILSLDLLRRHVDAVGAQWGLLSERAFREGLRGLVERELGLRAEKWVWWDGEGYVYGHPSEVDVDVAVHDDKVVLVEVKSHVSRSDVFVFKRKAEFYERVRGKKPDRLVIVTPFVDEDALKTARLLQVEVYTSV